MAFLRAEKKKSGTYLRIIQSYKECGKPRHRTLYNLGKLEDYSPNQIEAIAHRLLALVNKPYLANNPLELFAEKCRYNYGFPLVVKYLFRKFELDLFIKRQLFNRKVQFDFISVIQLLISERLNEPNSKLKNYQLQEEYYGLKRVELQHIYRSLDLLSGFDKQLQIHLYKQQQNLFSLSLDVVFYDVTTLYFESYDETEGKLRQKGYSKDGKANKTQVVLGLLVDKLRNPIAYRLYPGNTYEGHTLIDALRTLTAEFPVDKVFFVADRGMLSKDNIALIEQSGMDYIIGERLKSLSELTQEELIDKTTHIPFDKLHKDEKESYTYKTVNIEGKRVICTWSSKRARKDEKDRERLIEKAKFYISNPSKLRQHNKKGAKRYLSLADNKNPLLDKQIIEQDKKYDGFLAISTNNQQLHETQILEQYNNLFEVEHAFRMMKSVIEVRPMFHWNDKRIKGHTAMCFLAYTFLNHLTKGLQWTEDKLLRTLDKMQISEIEQKKSKNKVYMRSAIDETSRELITRLKLNVPSDMASQNSINQIFN